MAKKATKKKAKKAARKKKFPTPEEIPDVVGVAQRGREDIIDIYNTNAQKKANNLSKVVQQWVEEKAAEVGWDHVYWPKAYPKPTLAAGAVFTKGLVPRE